MLTLSNMIQAIHSKKRCRRGVCVTYEENEKPPIQDFDGKT